MKTITLPVSELKGVQLDWAFALALFPADLDVLTDIGKVADNYAKRHITLGFIDQNQIDVKHKNELAGVRCAMDFGTYVKYGESVLIAAARVYIASKLGDSVSVPEIES